MDCSSLKHAKGFERESLLKLRDCFRVINLRIRRAATGRPLPTADDGYPVTQLGGQLSAGELARPTGAGRPSAAVRGFSEPARRPSLGATRFASIKQPFVASRTRPLPATGDGLLLSVCSSISQSRQDTPASGQTKLGALGRVARLSLLQGWSLR